MSISHDFMMMIQIFKMSQSRKIKNNFFKEDRTVIM